MDSLTFSQRLNFRLPEVVQGEVSRMRSHNVKRVEWKIEQASTLKSCFSDGKCICSAPFAAGGIDNMSFAFYPTGYAGARMDYCSLFVHMANVSSEKLERMHLILRIGRHRFELEPLPDNSNLRGRLNVCRYDQSFEHAEDFALITL